MIKGQLAANIWDHLEKETRVGHCSEPVGLAVERLKPQFFPNVGSSVCNKGGGRSTKTSLGGPS